MAGAAPNMDQFELYFKRADLDHDGRISGAEAVSFFQASGLPTPVLAQIWTYADHNRTGYLGRQEFYNALKLVTVAQSKRELTSDIVKAALYGPASTKIPPPQINLGALRAPQSNSNTGQPAPQPNLNVGPPAPQSNLNAGPPAPAPAPVPAPAPAPSVSTGIRGPQGYSPQESQNTRTTVLNSRPPSSNLSNDWLGERTGGAPPGIASQPPRVASSGWTPTVQPRPHGPNGTQFVNKPSQPSQVNVGQQPGGGQNQQVQSTLKNIQKIPVQNPSTFPLRAENVASSQSLQPWPKMTQSSVQKYTKVFMEVDTDRDGKITGEQARTLFLSWRVPREILKQVWDLSDQDNDSMLSLKEFCIALYLMERYREGHPLPKVLPPGVIFEGTPSAPSGQPPAPHGGPAWRPVPGVQQGHRTTASRPPRPVPVPIDEDVQQPTQQKRTVPTLEKHLVDQLSNEEQSSLNAKFQEATEADKKVGELEKEIMEAKQKIEFYRNKMQEIVLYKSRCDSRLNEIVERVSADKREVESLSKKYEEKYKQAGDVASKLTLEEATFRDIQEKKMELYRAIVKLEQDGKPEDVQARVDGIQADLEEQVKALNERCKMYGLRGKPTLLVELPFGWQTGIQEGAADWDENWDKFEDEGFTFVKELTLDVQNVIAPPKPKSLPIQNKSAFRGESSTTVSSSHNKDKSENLSAANDMTSDDESAEHHKESSIKTPPDSPASTKATESPSKIFRDSPAEDNSPRGAVKTQSESVFSDERRFDEPGKATFDTRFDSDSAWDFTSTSHKDMDEESLHGNTLFGSSNSWGLNPIRTDIPKKSTFTFDSVPSTPAYSYAGSPPGNNLFHNQGPFSAFADSVPSTPAYSTTGSPRNDLNRPFTSTFADSVPSTPMSTNDEDHSFNNFSRFDSFNSTNPRDSFSRFDSFRSTAQDSELDRNLTRFDSMRSSADSDFGHSLFQPRESFARFDSMRSTSESSDFNHGFPSFDDADPFGSSDPFRSHDPFKASSVESETPSRDSVDGWKAF